MLSHQIQISMIHKLYESFVMSHDLFRSYLSQIDFIFSQLSILSSQTSFGGSVGFT